MRIVLLNLNLSTLLLVCTLLPSVVLGSSWTGPYSYTDNDRYIEFLVCGETQDMSQCGADQQHGEQFMGCLPGSSPNGAYPPQPNAYCSVMSDTADVCQQGKSCYKITKNENVLDRQKEVIQGSEQVSQNGVTTSNSQTTEAAEAAAAQLASNSRLLSDSIKESTVLTAAAANQTQTAMTTLKESAIQSSAAAANASSAIASVASDSVSDFKKQLADREAKRKQSSPPPASTSSSPMGQSQYTASVPQQYPPPQPAQYASQQYASQQYAPQQYAPQYAPQPIQYAAQPIQYAPQYAPQPIQYSQYAPQPIQYSQYAQPVQQNYQTYYSASAVPQLPYSQSAAPSATGSYTYT